MLKLKVCAASPHKFVWPPHTNFYQHYINIAKLIIKYLDILVLLISCGHTPHKILNDFMVAILYKNKMCGLPTQTLP